MSEAERYQNLLDKKQELDRSIHVLRSKREDKVKRQQEILEKLKSMGFSSIEEARQNKEEKERELNQGMEQLGPKVEEILEKTKELIK